MTISVNTNASALIALQNLNSTNDRLDGVQQRISTGLKIANARDDASVWAIAQGQRAENMSLQAIRSSLDRGTSIADVAMTAGAEISDLLNQIKAKVTAAREPSLDATSRTLLDNDFKSLVRQLSNRVTNATFDGANILNGSLASDIRFLANADATSFITLSARNMSLGGAIVTIPSTASITTAALASAMAAIVDASITNVNRTLGDIGAQARQIESHNIFVAKLGDVLETGIGHLVDADMARESARLQALQVQQQLGAQALSIANSAPQVILSLFRN
jgi:flagellin